ncbi:MAG: copper resistance protein CopC [Bacillota bacterium]|nr:copper resistance protein CopC [Bacillota bacterium]MDP4171308.1 copper resistance protein CopC [Bacillota bacterium]
MLRKIALLTSLLFIPIGTQAFAHSHLEDSSPKNGEVVTHSLNQIHLNFEENLEETSTFSVKSENGTAVHPSKIIVKDNHIVGTFDHILANGAYTIYWKNIGTDGHPLEGTIPFSVNVKSTSAVKSKEEPAKMVIGSTEKITKKHEVLPAVPNNEKPLMSYAIPGSIGTLIILALGSYWLVFRKKHL